MMTKERIKYMGILYVNKQLKQLYDFQSHFLIINDLFISSILVKSPQFRLVLSLNKTMINENQLIH
jgi:hypothetical protein